MNVIDRIRKLAEIANDADIPLADRSQAAQLLEHEKTGALQQYDRTSGPDWEGLLSGDSRSLAEKLDKYAGRMGEAESTSAEDIGRIDSIPADIRNQFPDMQPANVADIAARDASLNAQDDYKFAHLAETAPYSAALYDKLGLPENARRWAHGARELASTAASMYFPESVAGIATQIPINFLDSVDALPALKELYQDHPKTAVGAGALTYGSQLPDWMAMYKALR